MPALDETVGLPRSSASSSVDSHKIEVGSREFGNLKRSVPKISGLLEDFAFLKLKGHFEAFTSMVSCMSSFLAVHDVMMGDYSKDTQYFIFQGLSEEHIKIKTARVAWT